MTKNNMEKTNSQWILKSVKHIGKKHTQGIKKFNNQDTSLQRCKQGKNHSKKHG